MTTTVTAASVIPDVVNERYRQERLCEEGRFLWTCADPAIGDTAKLPVLVEEVGEVAKALNDREGQAALRTELIQVAATAIAWVESIDAEAARFLRIAQLSAESTELAPIPGITHCEGCGTLLGHGPGGMCDPCAFAAGDPNSAPSL